MYIAHHLFLLLINYIDLSVERYDGFNTLRHSCIFDYQKMVLKTFPAPIYLRSEDGLV